MGLMLNKHTRILTQAALASSLMMGSSGAWAVDVNVAVVVTQQTNTDGTVNVTPAGSINVPAGSIGIEGNKAGAPGIITIQPNNTAAYAIQTVDSHAINVSEPAHTVTIGANSKILAGVAGGSGIHLDPGGTAAIINNSGQITSTSQYAISVNETGATISNLAGGILTVGTAGNNVVNLKSNFISVTNAGKIESISTVAAVGAAIFSGAITGQIINSGIIDGFENDAIHIEGMTGNITNTGTITTKEDGIFVGGAGLTGNITNNVGGNIITLGTTNEGGKIDAAIRLQGNVTAVTNAGNIIATSDLANAGVAAISIDTGPVVTTITNNATGVIKGIKGDFAVDDGAYAINISKALTGSILNDNGGLITTDKQHAILINDVAVSGTLTNSGTISVTDNTTTKQAISFGGVNSRIIGGIINNATGVISVATPNETAINLAASNLQTNITNTGKIIGHVKMAGGANSLLTNSGTLTGNVDLSAGGGNVLKMDGGTITGTVTSGAVASILDINGGVIGGIITLGVGGDTVNIAGGTINKLIGGAGADTLNIKASFTSNTDIKNIETINVSIKDTIFTVNAPVTGVNTALTTAADTQIIMNSDISGGPGAATTNAGTLTINSGKTLTMEGAFTNTGTITNAGTITKTTIDVQVGNGTITNSGLINGINKEALTLSADFTGDIVNQSTGVITTAGTNTPGEAAIKLGGFTLTGAITNSGTINVTDATGGPAILSGDSAVTKGITNAGNISSLNATAIDLSASTKSLLFTNTGTVSGNVLLSQAAVGGDTTFIMNGGTILGNVTAGAGANASTLEIAGGTITGDVTLSALNAGIINLGAATIQGNMVGKGVLGQTLNIVDDFNSTGAVTNIKTINVLAGNDFTVNAPITGLDTALTINKGATLFVNSDITGTGVATNTAGGNVAIYAGKTLNMNTYTQNVAGNLLGFQIQDAANYGKMTTTGIFDLTGSNLTVQLGSGLINTGDVFKIIDGGPGSLNGSNFIQPNSATISFTPSLVGDDLILTGKRTSLQTISGGGITSGLASALDQIFPGDGVFKQIFIGLDSLGTAAQVNDALLTLLPATGAEVNEGIADILDKHQGYTIRHLEHLASRSPVSMVPQIPTIGGINNGDMIDGEKGIWGYAFYTMGDEKTNGTRFGYDMDGSGLGIGWDARIVNDTIIGASFGYSQADYESKNRLHDTQEQSAYVFSLYGEHDLVGKPMYVDGMASVTYNKYKIVRHVSVAHVAGDNTANFNALYYDLYARFNYDKKWQGYTLTPFMTFEYGHFSPDEYTEKGFLPMIVRPQSTNVMEPGVGLRVWWENHVNEARYLPELYASFQYDILNEGLTTNASFASTGTQSFLIESAKASAFSYNLGFNLTAYNNANWMFALGYDYEGRTGFSGHTANLKLRYSWD